MTLLLLAAATILCQAADYTDVPAAAWYAETVAEVSEAGWMTGTAPGQFSPNRSITMAQAVESVYRCLGSPDRASRPDTFWYSASQDWLQELGLSLAELPLSAELTREEVAFLLYHGYCSVAEDPIYNAAFYYTDSDTASDYYDWALKFAYSMELLNGDSNGALHPKDSMTRAELASVLLRFDALLAEAQTGETEKETMELQVEVSAADGSRGFQVSLKDINFEQLESAPAEGDQATLRHVPVGRSYLSAQSLDGSWKTPEIPLRILLDPDAEPSLQVVSLPAKDAYSPSCQLNLTVPDLSAKPLRIYAETMDNGQWIRVTASLLPEGAMQRRR